MVGAPTKILVIRGGAIGDFVLTLPAISALRERFPRASLSLLGYPRNTALALKSGLVDEVLSLEARGLASFFGLAAELPPEYVARFRQFDLIVSYLYDPHSIFRDNVVRCTDARFVAGPHRPDDAGNLHATQVFLAPLAQFDIRAADAFPILAIAPQSLPRLPGERRLAVHPGSGSEQKNWPEPLWAELLATLAADRHLRLLLVGGEAEGERLTRLARGWPEQRLEVARSLPLPELAGRLAGCDFFLGHDSGIMHLAVAMDLPGLALWGPTSERVWGPRSSRMRVLRGPAGLASLAPEIVLARVRDFFAGHEHA